MKKILPTILLLALPGLSAAATVVTTWVNPTTNTDASSIPASGEGSLASARIEYGSCNGAVFGTKAGEVIRAMPVATSTLNLPVGTSCVRVKVTNTYGVESDASNVATKVVAPPKPNPPTQLSVTDPVVYEVKPNERTFAFDRGRAVGTVKIGAACDETRTVGDNMYALERPSRVKLTKTPVSTALVAECGNAT